MDVTGLCAAIRDWKFAQIPGGAADFDQLICDGNALRGLIETTACRTSELSQVTPYSAVMGMAARADTQQEGTMSRRCLESF